MRVARTGEEGLEAVRKGVDLVLLDLNLPGMDGLEVCRMIRRQQTTAHVPIIIVSARADEVDRVLGLEMGADDYVVKPFSLKELAARAKVALRRAGPRPARPPQGYRDENWEIEFDAYVVRYKGEEIRLTHKEFELFRYMVERPGRVLTRERLLERVWGWESDIDARSIDAHIRRLRLKLGAGAPPRRDGGGPRLPLRQVAATPSRAADQAKLVLCGGESPMAMIQEGKKAPEFELASSEGGEVSLKGLKGKTVVLYFYPKDDTPGCTREACAFRDNQAALKKKGVVVLGVSGDSLASHDKFKAKYKLNFPLLSDPDKAVAKKYGAWGEKVLYGKKTVGMIRSTFVIDGDGSRAQGVPARQGRRPRREGAGGRLGALV